MNDTNINNVRTKELKGKLINIHLKYLTGFPSELPKEMRSRNNRRSSVCSFDDLEFICCSLISLPEGFFELIIRKIKISNDFSYQGLFFFGTGKFGEFFKADFKGKLALLEIQRATEE